MICYVYFSLCVLRAFLFFFLMLRRPPRSTRTDTLFPYTTLFRSYILLSIFWLENEFATFRYPVARAQPGRLRPKRAAQHLIFRGEYRRGAKGGRRLPGRLEARRRMHERGRRGDRRSKRLNSSH